MTNSTLDSIAAEKARLTEELRQLEQQEDQLRNEQTDDAFNQVISLLHLFSQNFDTKQKAQIAAHVVSEPRAPKKKAGAKEQAPPKYWLPHTQETWSGRGRPPRSFKAWEGTVSHREWKAKHPNEKYPKYPG
jgi:DNA-binding protein H-NS